jgi:hypothetical protein
VASTAAALLRVRKKLPSNKQPFLASSSIKRLSRATSSQPALVCIFRSLHAGFLTLLGFNLHLKLSRKQSTDLRLLPQRDKGFKVRAAPELLACLLSDGSVGLTVSELPTSISQSFPPRGQVSGDFALNLPLPCPSVNSVLSRRYGCGQEEVCLSHNQLNVTAVFVLTGAVAHNLTTNLASPPRKLIGVRL